MDGCTGYKGWSSLGPASVTTAKSIEFLQWYRGDDKPSFDMKYFHQDLSICRRASYVLKPKKLLFVRVRRRKGVIAFITQGSLQKAAETHLANHQEPDTGLAPRLPQHI